MGNSIKLILYAFYKYNYKHMGIRLLNSFLNNRCKHLLKNKPLMELSGKKICVDINIYLHKFLANDVLLEKMYLLCSIFRYYNIIPIFIFDGKPPKEKSVEIYNRRVKRNEAIEEYDSIINSLNDNSICKTKEIIEKLNKLKRQMVRVKSYHINIIKELLTSYGMQYITALGEADILCAELVIKKKVYACLSDDTDLFVYGCPRVLRYLNLNTRSVILYDTKKILSNLNIDIQNFKWICVLSGSDYLNTNTNIFNYFNLYEKYSKRCNNVETQNFVDWLIKKKIINNDILEEYKNILNLYNLEINSTIHKYKYMLIKYTYMDKKNIETILKKERFIFPQVT
jgi:5'-3' exonuclease